jgi:predicted acyl esterase
MRFGLMLPSQATGSRRQVAAQTIFHDQRYPSHILLPVIPR